MTHRSGASRLWDLRLRDEWPLLVGAVGAAIFFFASIGRVWPLLDVDLNAPRDVLEARAREALAARGLDAAGFVAATDLVVAEGTLEYVETAFGQERAQAWAREGLPLSSYRIALRRGGTVDTYDVALTPDGRTLAWWRNVEEDEAAPPATLEEARAAALREMEVGLGLRSEEWREAGFSERERPARTDRTFTYERYLSRSPELRDRLQLTVSGPIVTAVGRALVPPASWAREKRAAEAGPTALFNVGVALLCVAIVAAFFVFLLRLRAGTAQLRWPAVWAAVVFVCTFATALLAESDLLRSWDTLVPRWVSTFSYLISQFQGRVWMLLVLLTVTSAADALDRESGANRGRELRLLASGCVRDPRVGGAVVRGFFVGLLCGAALAGSVVAITVLAGGSVLLQPRGFFFFGINSITPALSTLLFFANVALLEELGYRFFCGTWLLGLTRRRWIAVVAPAVIYGLTHTQLDFLPPADPFWGRALALTLVGCVWGIAFLRYGALAVVVSHLMADLFIFNWPRLASGDPWLTAGALVTFAAPLLLAVPSLVAPRASANEAPAG